MLPILGINFQSRFTPQLKKSKNAGQNISQNTNLYQTKPDTVSFSGKEKIVQTVEKETMGFLTQLFDMKFLKTGNKFLSENPVALFEIEEYKAFYNMILDGKTNLLKCFDQKEDLGIFAKQANDLLAMKSLIFTGAEGQIFADAGQGVVGSRFSLTLIPENKISSTLLSNGMREVLSKEFEKNNDLISVKFRNEKFTLKNDHMFEDDLKSPMRNVIIEKE